MNNVPDENGNKASRIKLIRAESIGKYALDNKGQWGENNWETSALQEVLNSGAYWNRTSGTCPSGQNGATTSCDFSSNGLTGDAKNMITSVTWNLGGYDSDELPPVASVYSYERGTVVYSGNPTTWKGYVGLMYPSDYGFATGGSSRTECLSSSMYFWDEDDYNVCYQNDWVWNRLVTQWLLLHYTGSNHNLFYIRLQPDVSWGGAYGAYEIRPVVYLNTDTKFTGTHLGNNDDPYIIEK